MPRTRSNPRSRPAPPRHTTAMRRPWSASILPSESEQMDRDGAAGRKAFLLGRHQDETIGAYNRRQAGAAAGADRLHAPVSNYPDPAEIHPTAGRDDLA